MLLLPWTFRKVSTQIIQDLSPHPHPMQTSSWLLWRSTRFRAVSLRFFLLHIRSYFPDVNQEMFLLRKEIDLGSISRSWEGSLPLRLPPMPVLKSRLGLQSEFLLCQCHFCGIPQGEWSMKGLPENLCFTLSQAGNTPIVIQEFR